MAGPLAEAAVEIIADIGHFSDDLQKKLQASAAKASAAASADFGKIEKQVDSLGQRIARSIADGATRAADALRKIPAAARGLDQVQRAAAGVAGVLGPRIVAAADQARNAISRVAGEGTQLGRIATAATAAGRAIASALVGSSEQARTALGLIDNERFLRVTTAAVAAAERVGGVFAAGAVRARAALGLVSSETFTRVVAGAQAAGARVAGAFSAAAAKAKTALSQIDMSRISGGLKTFGTVMAAATVGTVGFGLKAAASLEQTQIAFSQLLGSAQAAGTFIRNLQQFAATTPFEFQGLSKNAIQLLAIGKAAGISRAQILPTMRTLGDMASAIGAGQPEIDRVVYALGQMASKGKVSSDDLSQIGDAFPGFSAVAAIAASKGISTAKAFDLIGHGAISGQQGIAAILKGMQDFKGAAGSMQKQSLTLNGIFSTFKDTISLKLTAAFQPLIPVVKNTLNQLIPILDKSLGQMAPRISAFVAGLAPLLTKLIPAISPAIAATFDALSRSLRSINPGQISQAGSALTGLLRAVAPLGPAISLLVGSGLRTLGPILVALTPLIHSLASALNAVAASPAGKFLGPLVAQFLVVRAVTGSSGTAFRSLAATVRLLASGLGLLARGALGLARNIGPVLGSALANGGRAAAGAARQMGAYAASLARAGASAAVSGLRSGASGIAASGRAAASAAAQMGRFSAGLVRAGAASAVSGLRASAAAMTGMAVSAARAAVALGSMAIAQARAGLAAAAATIRTAAYAAITGVVKVATAAWTVVQWALDAAMDANPIGIVVIAIAALVAGVVLAYNKVSWFRAGVQAVFSFLQTAVVFAINFVRDHWKLILIVILGPLGLLIVLVATYWRRITSAISAAISFVINFVRTHWRLIISIVLGPLGLLIVLVATYWRRIYSAVSAAVSFVINFVRSHWQLLVAIVLGPLGAVLVIVIRYWGQIRSAISGALNAIVSRIRGGLSTARAVVSSIISSITGVFSRGWSAVTSRTSALASALRSKISSLMSSLRGAFSAGVSAIGSAWGRLSNVAKAPVNFMINTVYNRGIRGLWNTVMGWLHISGMRLDPISGLARGGTLDNPMTARPMVTNGPMAIVGEGRAQWPEYVIPTDPRFRDRARGLWAAAGSKLHMLAGGGTLAGGSTLGMAGVQMLSGGGVLGSILGGIKKAAGKVFNIGQQALDLIANPGKIFDTLAGPVLSLAKGTGAGPWAQAIAAIPPKLLGVIKNAALQVVKSFGDGYGSDGFGVVKAAASMIGRGDDAGPNNNWLTRAWGMPGAPWCAMFVSEAIKIAGAGSHYSGYPSAAVHGYSDRMKHVSSGRPGDLGVYAGGGHINVIEKALGGGSYSTIGGNQNALVQRGVRSNQSWFLRPMALGGILARQSAQVFSEARNAADRHEDQTPLVQLMRRLTSGGVRDLSAALIKSGATVTAVTRDSGGPVPSGSFAYNGRSQPEWMLSPEAVELLGGAPAVAGINAAAARGSSLTRRAAVPQLGGSRSASGVTVSPGAAGAPTVQVFLDGQLIEPIASRVVHENNRGATRRASARRTAPRAR